MNLLSPLASVVIPTHNRRESVCRALAALARQTCDPERFEIVVAANGCTDGTVESIRAIGRPRNLRVLDLPTVGAAAARNAGALEARGPLLIFLDDDIDAAPEFVEAHLEAHGLRETVSPEVTLPFRVAIGYLPASLQPEQDLFAIALRGWWEGMFDRIREPGHRFSYRDLLTGNFSMPRDHFIRLGRFDERYRCHEDYEFGYRLIRAGAEFVFAERAWGRHRDLTRLDRACLRKREEGRADVQLARQYPELRPALPLAQRRSRKHGLARRIAFLMPAAGDRVVPLVTRLLHPLERVGARSSWRRVLNWVLGYWYERGLADEAGRLDTLRPLLDVDRSTTPQFLRVDATDLDAAERKLDAHRPAAVAFCVGAREFGRLVSEPGTEPFAGRHLRPTLARIWYRAYVEALLAGNRLPLLAGPRADTPHTGSEPAAMDPIGLLDPAPRTPGH